MAREYGAYIKITIVGLLVAVTLSTALIAKTEAYAIFREDDAPTLPVSGRLGAHHFPIGVADLDLRAADFARQLPASQFMKWFEQGLVDFYGKIYYEGLLLDTPGAQNMATGSLGYSIAAITALMQRNVLDANKWLGRLERVLNNIKLIQENQPKGDWLSILRGGKSILTAQIILDNMKFAPDQSAEGIKRYILGLDFVDIAREKYGFNVVESKIKPTEEEIEYFIRGTVTQADIDNVLAYGYDGWLAHFIGRDLKRSGEKNSEFSSVDTAIALAGILYLASYVGEGHSIYQLAEEILTNVDMNSPQFYSESKRRFLHGWAPYTGGLGHDYWGGEEILMQIVRGLATGERIVLPATGKEGFYIDSAPPYVVSYQSAIWTYTYAHVIFDLYNYQLDGSDWWRNSVYGIIDNREYAIQEGNTLENNKGYYPYDAWISTHTVFGTRENPSGRFQMDHGAKPGWAGIIDNDGSFSPYSALSALPFVPFQAWQSMLYHYVLSPELTVNGRSPYFGDATKRDPFLRGLAYPAAYNPEANGLNVGVGYLAYLNAMTGAVWETFMRHPRMQALVSNGSFTPIEIEKIEEFDSRLSSSYVTARDGNLPSLEQNTKAGDYTSAIFTLRTIIDAAKHTSDYDDFIGRLSSLPETELKNYLLAEAYVAKAHNLAAIVNSYPDQRSMIAFQRYINESASLYSTAWSLLGDISSRDLMPQVLALQFCIQKNNFMIKEQEATFEKLSLQYNAMRESGEVMKIDILVVETIKRYDYEASLISASFSYYDIDGEKRLRLDKTLYDWYREKKEQGAFGRGGLIDPLDTVDIYRALEDLRDGRIDDLLSRRVYRYFE